MHLDTLQAWLALFPPTAGSGDKQSPAPWYIQFFPFILLLVVFYVALIRPQQKKAKEQGQMLKSLRAGDKIVTSSGVVGVVITVKESTVTLRSADTKLEILKSSVSAVTERSGESAEARS
jgi:preprotein translocase subunit YajC